MKNPLIGWNFGVESPLVEEVPLIVAVYSLEQSADGKWVIPPRMLCDSDMTDEISWSSSLERQPGPMSAAPSPPP